MPEEPKSDDRAPSDDSPLQPAVEDQLAQASDSMIAASQSMIGRRLPSQKQPKTSGGGPGE